MLLSMCVCVCPAWTDDALLLPPLGVAAAAVAGKTAAAAVARKEAPAAAAVGAAAVATIATCAAGFEPC
jgi:hypothetical protein